MSRHERANQPLIAERPIDVCGDVPSTPNHGFVVSCLLVYGLASSRHTAVYSSAPYSEASQGIVEHCDNHEVCVTYIRVPVPKSLAGRGERSWNHVGDLEQLLLILGRTNTNNLC